MTTPGIIPPCKNCGAIVSASDVQCNVCGSPIIATSGAPNPVIPHGYCGSCGTALPAKYAPCPKCGHVKTSLGAAPNPQQAQPTGSAYKNQGTALVLAAVLGFFGICGIGHFYLGKVGRGVIILIAGIILAIIALASFWWGLIIYIPFFVWTIYDTNQLCKQYNHFLATNKRAPW